MRIRKRVNLEEKEDRISSLPDSIIQHILSFLPSTKEVVRTGILSKHWQNQWNHVPVLIFNSNSSTGMSVSKIHLPDKNDPQSASKIRFATRKHVEKLYLSSKAQQLLPTFLFNHTSLVELNTLGCTFMPNIRKVNWGCLTTLNMLYSKLTDQAMERILSGSPSLESLKLSDNLSDFDKLVIASKSLKILILTNICFNRIVISCQNLKKLYLGHIIVLDGPGMFTQAIENVISHSLLLEAFEFRNCCGCFDQILKLVITSKSLKRLILEDLKTFAATFEISCPNLKQLKLSSYLKFEAVKLLNLPSSLYAVIDVHILCEDLQIRMVEDILQSLQHVKHLELGTSFIMDLSNLELEGCLANLPMLNIKCLIFNSVDLNEHPYGIANLLRSSLVLEKLIIKAPHFYELIINEDYDYREKLNEFGENYWNSNASVFNCFVSHLKTIEILGFPRRDHNRKLVLNFIQFLLKNARVLEMVSVRLKDEKTLMSKVSEEILSLPKCSQRAIIGCFYFDL